MLTPCSTHKNHFSLAMSPLKLRNKHCKCQNRMYMSLGRRLLLCQDAGLGKKAREGRIGDRKEECQCWTKARGRSHKHDMCHPSHKCFFTVGHIVLQQNTSPKASSTGMNCQSPRDNLPAASSQCFALAFPDACKKKWGEEGPAKFSQIVYSKKMAAGAPSCSWRKQTHRLPMPRRPVAFLLGGTDLFSVPGL